MAEEERQGLFGVHVGVAAIRLPARRGPAAASLSEYSTKVMPTMANNVPPNIQPFRDIEVDRQGAAGEIVSLIRHTDIDDAPIVVLEFFSRSVHPRHLSGYPPLEYGALGSRSNDGICHSRTYGPRMGQYIKLPKRRTWLTARNGPGQVENGALVADRMMVAKLAGDLPLEGGNVGGGCQTAGQLIAVVK